jgi:4-hydroxy-tetrahydrodipicolinate reductase
VVNVAVAGAGGRMGRMLVEALLDAADLRLSGALVRNGSPLAGQDAGAALGRTTGVVMTSDPDQALRDARILIDFTGPAATLVHLEACVRLHIGMVIGTTGFSAGERELLRAAGKQIGLVVAPNMSVGVNLVFKLLEVAAAALGPQFDVEISEIHHRNKRDAPSGTALRMGEVVARARGTSLEGAAVYERHGANAPRREGSIGFAALRAGDIVGDHTALFAGPGERIEITHRASSRATYAEGSLAAARFLLGASPALYDMQDVLGLR